MITHHESPFFQVYRRMDTSLFTRFTYLWAYLKTDDVLRHSYFQVREDLGVWEGSIIRDYSGTRNQVYLSLPGGSSSEGGILFGVWEAQAFEWRVCEAMKSSCGSPKRESSRMSNHFLWTVEKSNSSRTRESCLFRKYDGAGPRAVISSLDTVERPAR